MKAVLLLHGFLTDDDDFQPLFAPLEEEYDHVERFLFPGHGKKPNYKEFTTKATFDKLHKEFDKLQEKYEIVDVIGFSMGGALGAYLSTVRDFNKLVLLAPANKYINIAMPFSRFAAYVKMLYGSLGKKVNNNPLRSLESIMADDYRGLQMALKKLIPNYTYHTLTTFIRIINQANANLRVIKNPTLVIWGELDQFVPKRSSQFIYHICSNKNKKRVILEDISHLMLHSMNNGQIIQEVMDFLRQ